MKQLTVTWRCPKCGHTEVQPAKVKYVSHLCGLGERLVQLEPEVPAR